MNLLTVLLCAALLTAAAPAVRADVVWSPFDQATYAVRSAAPWLLVVALVGITLLLLWRFRKKK